MEAADTDDVECGADQLFLATRTGCKLGARAVLSRAACDARVGLPAWIHDGGAAAGLFSDALVSGMGGRQMEADIVVEVWTADGTGRTAAGTAALLFQPIWILLNRPVVCAPRIRVAGIRSIP